MKVEKISALGGVSIAGVDLTAHDPEVFRQIKALYDEHGLVVIRKQAFTKPQLVAAGDVFGGTMLEREGVTFDPEAPGVVVMSTRGPRGDVMPAEQDLVGDIDWHTDHGYVIRPMRGKILYAVAVPEEGGRTGFIDGELTYDTLPDELKEKIAGLHVVQSWNRAQSYQERSREFRYDGHNQLRNDRFPDLLFPLVYEHPITGRKILNLPPLWCTGIAEMPGAEGDALLARLQQHATQERFQYWHTYAVGDAVAWDNWRFMHCASGTPGKYVRTMWVIALNAGPALAEPLSRAA